MQPKHSKNNCYSTFFSETETNRRLVFIFSTFRHDDTAVSAALSCSAPRTYAKVFATVQHCKHRRTLRILQQTQCALHVCQFLIIYTFPTILYILRGSTDKRTKKIRKEKKYIIISLFFFKKKKERKKSCCSYGATKSQKEREPSESQGGKPDTKEGPFSMEVCLFSLSL